MSAVAGGGTAGGAGVGDAGSRVRGGRGPGRLAVDMLVPDTLDDPLLPSGGNRYDRQMAAALRDAGHRVRLRRMAGDWPHPDVAARRDLARALGPNQGSAVPPPGSRILLVDGLIASAAGDLVAVAARHRRVWALVHMLFGRHDTALQASEQEMVRQVEGIVTTSRWTRDHLIDTYGAAPDRLHVVPPGVDPAPPAEPDPGGGRLLCVAAVTAAKGYDLLSASLGALTRRDGGRWHCTCVGSLHVDPPYVARLRQRIRDAGLGDRMELTGALPPHALDTCYAATDLLLLPSRGETWGMVVTEALARGIPVLASDVGGVPEALGCARDGSLPGALLPPDDPAAWTRTLTQWLTEPTTRRRWRDAALDRRSQLPTWRRAAENLAAVWAPER